MYFFVIQMRFVILAISVKKTLSEDSASTQNVTEASNISQEASTFGSQIQFAESTTIFDIDTIINNITSQISQVSFFFF